MPLGGYEYEGLVLLFLPWEEIFLGLSAVTSARFAVITSGRVLSAD